MKFTAAASDCFVDFLAEKPVPIPQPSRRLVRAAPGDSHRPELEALIRATYRRQHGAQVEHFMPELVGIRDGDGRPLGVLGLRFAESGPLYVEHYLDEPVEAALGTVAGQSISRAEVVEVGNLAGKTCRAACRLVACLPSLLIPQHRSWAVFTATETVRALLSRLGAPLLEIGPAPANRAPEGDDWGRYYQNDPRVMACYLPQFQ